MVYLKHLLEFHAQGDPQTKSVYLSSDQRMQLQIKKLNLYIYIYIYTRLQKCCLQTDIDR